MRRSIENIALTAGLIAALLLCVETRADEGSMDVNLALTLIRSGRAAEVVPHLPRLVHQLRPLMALVRQQKELELSKKETVVHGSLQGVPRPLDQRP
jgi:hypothetical protein